MHCVFSITDVVSRVISPLQDEELIRFLIGGLGAGAQNEVEAVRIVRDPKTSLGKGIAFALFKSKMGRKTALALDGRELKGRPLRVTTIQSGGGPVTAGRAGAAWQGATATKTGRMRGLAMKKEGKSGKLMQKKGKGPSLKKQSGGKRPAVAAKKAKQLLAKGGKKKH